MTPNLSKFLGKRSSVCKKCNSDTFWVNRLGGVCCSVCRPNPGSPQSIGELRVENEKWVDGSVERFDLTDVAPNSTLPITASGPAAAATLPTPNGDARNKNGSENPVMVTGYTRRGIHGELSEQEIEIFTSDKLWDAKGDPWLVLKPKVRLLPKKKE